MLADCEEFAFVSLSLSLSLNPGLTHAILISLLRDNHDPEIERETEESNNVAFPHRIFFALRCFSFWQIVFVFFLTFLTRKMDATHLSFRTRPVSH